MSVLANSSFPDLPMQLRLLFVPVVAAEPGLLTPAGRGSRMVRQGAAIPVAELLSVQDEAAAQGLRVHVLPGIYSASAALSLSQSPEPGLQSIHPEWFTVAYRAILGAHCTDAYARDAYPDGAVDQYAEIFPAADAGVAIVALYQPLLGGEELSQQLIETSSIGAPLRTAKEMTATGMLERIAGEMAIKLDRCSGLRALPAQDSLEAACAHLISHRLAAIAREDARLATHVGQDRAHLVAESSVGVMDIVFMPHVNNPPLAEWDARVAGWLEMAQGLVPPGGLNKVRVRQLDSLALLDDIHPRDGSMQELVRHAPTHH